MTLKDRIQWLESLPRFKPKVDLNHLKEVIQQHSLTSDAIKIHVTGTNGKGSVVTLLTNILKHQYQVGTFISPYVYEFNERILINGNNIDNQLLEEGLIWVKDVHETMGPFSFFENLTFMTFYLFKRLNLDVWIIEVGIGGRLDATNILNYDASVITNIGADHLNILGPTLNDVCKEKLGIVKENGLLFTTIQKEFHQEVIHHIEEKHATLKFIQDEDIVIHDVNPLTFEFHNMHYVMTMKGIHQAYNASLAISVIHELFKTTSEDFIKLGLLETQVSGRFQEIKPQVIIDAAHNEHAIKALDAMLTLYYPNRPIWILMSVLGDKDINAMLNILNKDHRHIILTSFNDVRYQDISKHQNEEIMFIKDAVEAYQHINEIKTENSIVLITGSIHFIGYLGKLIK